MTDVPVTSVAKVAAGGVTTSEIFTSTDPLNAGRQLSAAEAKAYETARKMQALIVLVSVVANTVVLVVALLSA
jgi:hypothetical protein